MTFPEFQNLISKIDKIKLPGIKSHLEMIPKGRETPGDEEEVKDRNPQKSGVMALFYPDEGNNVKLALILRNTYPGVHSGQIGLPGGKSENSDNSLKETALRETEEEIGVKASQIKVIKKLTKLYIPPSNFWVQPFLGITDSPPNFSLQESEVEELIAVSLDDFMNDGLLTQRDMETSYLTKIRVPVFIFNDKIVWGATGMILNEIKDILKSL